MAKTTAKSHKTTASRSVPERTTVTRTTTREVAIPENYEPIGMWGYFGYEILFAIPVLGWIFCIAFALLAKNYNLRNFARSQFCFLIIYIVLFCLLAGFGVLETVLRSFGWI